MTVESFETIMRRNNITLVSGEEGTKVDTATSRLPKAFKYNMIVSAFFVIFFFCLLSNAGAASLQNRVSRS
jgi:hypothetical protein